MSMTHQPKQYPYLLEGGDRVAATVSSRLPPCAIDLPAPLAAGRALARGCTAEPARRRINTRSRLARAPNAAVAAIDSLPQKADSRTWRPSGRCLVGRTCPQPLVL